MARETAYTGVMPWPPRFLFTSGRLSVDFALTGGEGERARWERWDSPRDLADWMREDPRLGVVATPTERDLKAARRLREAIWHGAQAVVRGASVPGWVEEALERHAARAPLVPVLERGGMAWAPEQPASAVLSTVSRDAIELFGTSVRERLRECANPACGLLFVDLSRPGRRRWCTMRRCGNLNKLSRHRRGVGLAEEPSGRSSARREGP
jgi:predicted RNA-binding Zn ribbon-like protein